MVGPPTPHSEDIAALVDDVLSATGVIQTAQVKLTNVEGPVPFHSAWVAGGRQKVLRPGLAVLELWTGVVSWQSTADARSLSGIVMDETYIKQTQGSRKESPIFETFVVSVLRSDQPGVSCIHVWKVAKPHRTWRYRETWLTDLADDSDRRRSA